MIVVRSNKEEKKMGWAVRVKERGRGFVLSVDIYILTRLDIRIYT